MTSSPSSTSQPFDFELKCAHAALENADCEVVKVPSSDIPFQLAARSKANREQTWAVRVVSKSDKLVVDDLDKVLASGRAMSLKSAIFVCKEEVSDEIKAASQVLKVDIIDGDNFQKMITEIPADIYKQLLTTEAANQRLNSFQTSHHQPTTVEPVVEAKPEPVVEAKPEPVVEAKPEQVDDSNQTIVINSEQFDQFLNINGEGKSSTTHTKSDPNWSLILVTSIALCLICALGVVYICHLGSDDKEPTTSSPEVKTTSGSAQKQQ